MLRERFKRRLRKNLITDAGHWGGAARSSDKSPVMRDWSEGAASFSLYGQDNQKREDSVGQGKAIQCFQGSCLEGISARQSERRRNWSGLPVDRCELASTRVLPFTASVIVSGTEFTAGRTG